MINIPKRHLCLILLLHLLFTFCTNKTETLQRYDLTDLTKAKAYRLSDLGISDITYIPLETDTSSLIHRIKKIEMKEDIIVLNDYKRIIGFDRKGKFISEIGKKGKGPKEYIYANDFSVDSKSSTYILSDNEDKIYIYDRQGEFINAINCPSKTTDIWILEKNIFCYSGNKDGTVCNNINIIDNRGKIVKSFSNKYTYEPRKTYTVLTTECLLSPNQNITFVKEIFSDTVFQYIEPHLVPSFILDHKEDIIPVSAREEVWGPHVFKKYIIQRKLFQTINKIYYEFSYQGNDYGFFGNLGNTQYAKLIDLNEGFINDIDGGINLVFNLCDDKGTLIGWTTPRQLKEHISTKKFQNSEPKYSKKKRELEKLANSLNENDNPILMLVKLKE